MSLEHAEPAPDRCCPTGGPTWHGPEWAGYAAHGPRVLCACCFGWFTVARRVEHGEHLCPSCDPLHHLRPHHPHPEHL